MTLETNEMKCGDCGGTQFYREVRIQADLQAVYDGADCGSGGEPTFCDFVGDLEDQIRGSNVIETGDTFTCSGCGTVYDPEDRDDDTVDAADEGRVGTTPPD